MNLILVVAAVLIQDRQVLLTQRPAGKSLAGLWEFPGGKLEDGETPEAALARELREELGISVASTDLRPLTFASHDYGGRHLLMPVYLCRSWGGVAEGREGQALAWVAASALAGYPMPPADEPLIPIVRKCLHE